MPLRLPFSDSDALIELGALAAMAACAATLLFILFRIRAVSGLKRSMRRGKPIRAERFLRDWIVAKNAEGATDGYKTVDRPGCYVILTNPGLCGRSKHSYDNVYVGQSLRVCSRVRQHLSGHGNGNVFADVRNGDRVVVRIVLCRRSKLNQTERRLIARYRAIDSYNDTKGGSARR